MLRYCIYSKTGDRVRKFSGSLESLAAYTHREIVTLTIKLLFSIGMEGQYLFSKEDTTTLRSILVCLVNIIEMDKTLEWRERDIQLLESTVAKLGPLLIKFTESLGDGAGHDANKIIKIHSMSHWGQFIRMYGSLKNFNTEQFESTHKTYKKVFARCSRTHNSSKANVEYMQFSVVTKFVDDLRNIVDTLDEKIQQCEGGSSTVDSRSTSACADEYTLVKNNSFALTISGSGDILSTVEDGDGDWKQFLPSSLVLENWCFDNIRLTIMNMLSHFSVLQHGEKVDVCTIHPSGRISCSDGWFTKRVCVPVYANSTNGWSHIEYVSWENGGCTAYGKIVSLVTVTGYVCLNKVFTL